MNRRPPKLADPAAVLRNFQNQNNKSLHKEAEDFRQLEDTRNALFGLLANDFKKELIRTEPSELKTAADKQSKEAMMEKINSIAVDLNHQSMSEGAQVIATATLNCILLLKEEINKLSFQNYTLKKKNEALEQDIAEIKAAIIKNEGINS